MHVISLLIKRVLDSDPDYNIRRSLWPLSTPSLSLVMARTATGVSILCRLLLFVTNAMRRDHNQDRDPSR